MKSKYWFHVAVAVYVANLAWWTGYICYLALTGRA